MRPCYSIEVALMMMSVWTRAVETEADVQTTGFVDDSAVRSKRGKTRDQAMTNLRQAWEVSKEFGSKAGDSELTLYTETTLTRLDRKVHAILFKATRWRSQALTFTLLARGHLIHPSQAVRYWSIRTVTRVLRQRTDLQEIVKELIRAKGDREERREEARGPVSVLFQHMKILGRTLSNQLVITRKYGTKMHLTKGEDQRRLETCDFVQGSSNKKQRRLERNSRNEHRLCVHCSDDESQKNKETRRKSC